MEALIAPLVLLLIVAVAALVVRMLVQVVTVHDYERGLRYRRGRFSGLVDPGTHFVARPFSEIRVLDGRPTTLTLEGQEVLTADGVALKASLAASYVVGDPVAAVTGDQSYLRALYLDLQLGLRNVLATGTIDEILATRREIGPRVLEATASGLARIGIELMSVEVRDLMLPGDLKRAFAGVVTARKDGEAALERARSETASLRSLANAGRLVEENPGALQLRLLQELGSSSGNSVMLTMPDGHGANSGGAESRAATRGGRSGSAARSKDTATPGSNDA
jgi:regulator of protease activity HflC (stomatin/prohibitin superfamily)